MGFRGPILRVLAVLIGVGTMAAASPVGASEAPPAEPTVEIIVSLEAGADGAAIGRVAEASAARGVAHRPDLAVLEVPADEAARITGALDRRGDVAFVAPIPVARMAATPNDQYFSRQWNLGDRARSAGSANWQPIGSPTLGAGTTVAVLDTGVTPHADIDGLLPGRDFVANDNDASDPHGHGTHVAGTVAETTGNGIGAAGVAPGASVLPGRVLDEKGNAPYDKIFSALAWATEAGADIINLSLAGPSDSGICDAVSRAVAAGVVVVAAAGNDNGPVGYPAACADAIAVAAVSMSGLAASYSNFGPSIDIAAPGGEAGDLNLDLQPDGILQYSVFNGQGGYYYSAGTSMASPHVAGAAAIVLSVRPNATPAQVRQVLTSTASEAGVGGVDAIYGAGLLDVTAVMTAANALPHSAPAPAPAPAPAQPAPAQQPAPAPSSEPAPAPAPESTQPAPSQPAPAQPAPAPSQPAPGQPAPSQPAPSQPAPGQPAPSRPSPAPEEARSPSPEPSVSRLSGSDRYATAAAISATAYPSGSEHVWVATGGSFADALASGAAAGRRSGPLLLVEACGVPSSTAAEIARLKPAAVTVVGGPSAVCDGVLAHLHSLTGAHPARVAGPDRYSTATAISRAHWSGGAATVVLASGTGFADALAAGPLAATQGAPLLLAGGCSLPDATAAELDRLRPGRIVVMGGTGAICESVAQAAAARSGATLERLAGSDRFATAVAASTAGWPGSAGKVFVASGGSFADGLAAGAAAAHAKLPLLLVPSCGTLPGDVASALRRLGTTQATLAGGESAICTGMADQISSSLS